MALRANWKGVLKVAELACAVSLYTAASDSERIHFHTLNRKTGNRVHREFVDAETGKPVGRGETTKGYDTGNGDTIIVAPEDIAAVMPDSDKILDVLAFIDCGEADPLYFERPYYLAPSTPLAGEAFALLRDGMRKRKVAALAQTVLFRRMHTLLIRAHDAGLVATILNFDYEVKSADEAFAEIPAMKIEGEMLDLAQHIIQTKLGSFDPKSFDDRYEAALAELVQAKIEGRKIAAPKRRAPEKVVDLMEALRQSAGSGKTATKKKTTAKVRKAG